MAAAVTNTITLFKETANQRWGVLIILRGFTVMPQIGWWCSEKSFDFEEIIKPQDVRKLSQSRYKKIIYRRMLQFVLLMNFFKPSNSKISAS